MNKTTSQPPAMILDEFGYYFGHGDGLKDSLRQIEGIPDVAYLVKEGKVFVFDKLERLVSAQLKLNPDLPIEDLARGLVDEATVSAVDAVKIWGVVPEPYEVSGLMIRHRHFNAMLPGCWQNLDDLQSVLAKILLGEIHAGVGEFTYRGQPMTLCASFDPSLLPPRPVILQAKEPESFYSSLDGVLYEPGFEPISESLFNDVKSRELSWKNDCAKTISYTRQHAEQVWALVAKLGLDSLNDQTDEVPDYGQDDFAELRSLYPELSMLSDGSFYSLFDQYQMDCCYINGWTANRDDGFLFYLLSQVASRQLEGNEVGKWIAYYLLRGDSLVDAIACGLATNLYDNAIFNLARRVADIMRFLSEEKNNTELHGRKVTTAMDIFRLGRKIGHIQPVIVTQS
ncbi:TPA: hypothetical protein ACSP3W_000499 [Aeromonas veronii]|uniref:hypothetical protein n=1 Tax=Aeromonas veronii TaxID=654 RepID=UPI001880EA05|nr:hypothetical protein [Aeromonas veronii]MBE8745337.1 hypothetical protein [Aeromonas veronii]